MSNNQFFLPLWRGAHSKIAIVYAMILLSVVLIYFNEQAVHPIWFGITFIVVFIYFYILQYCTINWIAYSRKKFEKKLFWYSLIFRVATSILLIIVAELTWGIPDYVGAVDAKTYHDEALIIADLIRSFNFSGAYSTAISFTGSIDNSGPPLLLGFIFALFGKYYIVGSLFYAIIGTFSVLFLYRTGLLIWGEDVARTSGLMFMHFPLSLFYSVVFLKEGIVIFLLLLIVYLITSAINGRRLSLFDFFLVVLSMVVLFFFRTAVGALLAILVPTALLLNRYRGNIFKSWAIGLTTVGIFGFIIYSLGEYEFFLNRIYSADTIGDQREAYIGFQDVSLLGTSLREIALVPVYFLIAVITPLAGMVEVGTRHGTSHDHNYYTIAGTVIWNIFTYFSLIGFYYSVREKLFNSFLVWAFTGGYLYILIATVLFTRDRFAYIGMPLMLILAAVGIQKSKHKIYWYIYLIMIGLATVVWNYLRLSVRGIN